MFARTRFSKAVIVSLAVATATAVVVGTGNSPADAAWRHHHYRWNSGSTTTTTKPTATTTTVKATTTTAKPATTTTAKPATTTTAGPPSTTAAPTTTVAPPVANGTITDRPAQAASIMWDGGESRASAYAHPGGLVAAGRDNYDNAAFKNVSANGGTVLIYLDPMIDNSYGRYHTMLLKQSTCGAAVPLWPGSPSANEWGNLNDFRAGGIEQQKLECVLETMVAENPHMGGWFADDIGSRSWYPNINWNSWSAADKQAYRDGAIALTQTFRKVADKHGLIFIVNGTWTANDGGGYPDATKTGNALADGGFVEHHDGESAYFATYACSSQWAAQSSITKGKAFMWSVTESDAERVKYADTGCYSFVNNQPTDNYDYAAPWGASHATGLPSRVAR